MFEAPMIARLRTLITEEVKDTFCNFNKRLCKLETKVISKSSETRTDTWTDADEDAFRYELLKLIRDKAKALEVSVSYVRALTRKFL